MKKEFDPLLIKAYIDYMLDEFDEDHSEDDFTYGNKALKRIPIASSEIFFDDYEDELKEEYPDLYDKIMDNDYVIGEIPEEDKGLRWTDPEKYDAFYGYISKGQIPINIYLDLYEEKIVTFFGLNDEFRAKDLSCEESVFNFSFDYLVFHTDIKDKAKYLSAYLK